MKTIFKIHPLYILMAIITAITGHFKDFILISLIIVIHEIGHITAGLYYHWKIEKILILPFGGITIFNEYLNRPIKEELVISVLGPIYQIVFYYLICCFHINSDLFTSYHYILLLFNLLPIVPLDGSKIITLFLEKFLPYKLANKLIIFISFVFFVILIFFVFINKNLLLLIILIFIFIKIIDQLKKQKYIFNKFLFERYLYDFKFKKRKIIKGFLVTKMLRDKKHLFYENSIYTTEKEVLKKLFDNYI